VRNYSYNQEVKDRETADHDFCSPPSPTSEWTKIDN